LNDDILNGSAGIDCLPESVWNYRPAVSSGHVVC
jgi:hypothetical protein